MRLDITPVTWQHEEAFQRCYIASGVVMTTPLPQRSCWKFRLRYLLVPIQRRESNDGHLI